MKGVKGVDVFCSSPASTAICVSIDQQSMVRSSSRVLDRHTPRLIDSRRSSKPPLRPSNLSRAASSSSSSAASFSISGSTEASSSNSAASSSQPNRSKTKPHPPKPRKSSGKQKDPVSPPDSSRYLLGDQDAFLDVFPDFDPVSSPLVPVHRGDVFSGACEDKTEESPHQVLRPSSPPTRHEQVVVLRVSLHCKGCEMKVRKHISRMEGVKSFNIDFKAKKVTVIGDVTPLGVLTSISRVKNAQFWPSPPPQQPPPPPPTPPPPRRQVQQPSSSAAVQLPLSVY